MQSADQNEATTDVLFNMVWEYIQQVIEDDWAEAVLVAVIEDDQSGLTYGRYARPGESDRQHSFDTDYRMYFVFDALRLNLRELTGKLWCQAEYTVQRNGQAHVELMYPAYIASP